MVKLIISDSTTATSHHDKEGDFSSINRSTDTAPHNYADRGMKIEGFLTRTILRPIIANLFETKRKIYMQKL